MLSGAKLGIVSFCSARAGNRTAAQANAATAPHPATCLRELPLVADLDIEPPLKPYGMRILPTTLLVSNNDASEIRLVGMREVCALIVVEREPVFRAGL